MRVRVACAIYKLVQGASLLQCSELFAIRKSTVAGVLKDVVYAINIEFRNHITFPTGEKLQRTMMDFFNFSGIPAIAGAINGTHIHIRKPNLGPEYYYHFKSGGYSLQMQGVVDRQKRFIDVVVGMPGSTHDSSVLRRRSLYHRSAIGTLFPNDVTFEGFRPYIIGDSGYPLQPWLLTPYRDGPGQPGQQSVLQHLYNRRLSRGRTVVENAFGILKQSFRELLHVTNLNVTFIPDVVVAYCLLHNVLLCQDLHDVARLLEVLQREGFRADVDEDPVLSHDCDHPPADEFDSAIEKRSLIGIFLRQQRNLDANIRA